MFSTEYEVDEEREWNRERVESALMVLCGYFGMSIETLRQFGVFDASLEELESLARHAWNGGKRFAFTAPTVPSPPRGGSGMRHAAVEVPVTPKVKGR